MKKTKKAPARAAKKTTKPAKAAAPKRAVGPGPEAILQLQFAMAASHILSSALQLELFTHVAGGATSAADIARAASADERGTRMLLDACCSFGLLAKKSGAYALTPLSSGYLVKGHDDYLGAFAESGRMAQDWFHLPEVVRTGQPRHRVEEKQAAEAFFPILIRSLHVINREPARRAARALRAPKGARVLDVACGSAVWSIPFVQADPTARGTALDFPGVLDHTREFLRKEGHLERYEFIEGDLKTADLGTDRYDVVVLGNIVHSEGEASSRDLFRRAFGALRPGGKLAIADMVPNDERTGPPFPVIFALNMLLHTQVGDVYTLSQYREWLRDAGFAKVETADIGSHSPLVVGVKK